MHLDVKITSRKGRPPLSAFIGGEKEFFSDSGAEEDHQGTLEGESQPEQFVLSRAGCSGLPLPVPLDRNPYPRRQCALGEISPRTGPFQDLGIYSYRLFLHNSSSRPVRMFHQCITPVRVRSNPALVDIITKSDRPSHFLNPSSSIGQFRPSSQRSGRPSSLCLSPSPSLQVSPSPLSGSL